MRDVIELLLKALAYSSGIAIGAAGITMIYMATRTFNFTHASMIAWGFYIVFATYSLLGGSPYYYIVLAALFSGMLGVIVYLGVNRRLLKAGASMVTLMMSTLGVDLIFFAFLNIFADYLSTGLKIPTARYFVLELKDIVLAKIGGMEIKAIGIIAPLVMIGVTIALHSFLTKTKFGIAMRAAIENPNLASILGINPEAVYITAWFIGGMLAGLAGGLLSLVISGYPAVGMTLIVTFFCGAIVGGLYSIFGSLLGGLLIGLSEYLGIYSLSASLGGWVLAYRPMIPLLIMAATLLVYPRGLGGINWARVRETITSYFKFLGGGR
ncbi:MAG: branched-chain amino acid ABC transporter permease [Thermoprotei archaeon]|nr:MAG: branched-chain amino acid ABC transporter permease [Thermoprotei archaeon]